MGEAVSPDAESLRRFASNNEALRDLLSMGPERLCGLSEGSLSLADVVLGDESAESVITRMEGAIASRVDGDARLATSRAWLELQGAIAVMSIVALAGRFELAIEVGAKCKHLLSPRSVLAALDPMDCFVVAGAIPRIGHRIGDRAEACGASRENERRHNRSPEYSYHIDRYHQTYLAVVHQLPAEFDRTDIVGALRAQRPRHLPAKKEATDRICAALTISAAVQRNVIGPAVASEAAPVAPKTRLASFDPRRLMLETGGVLIADDRAEFDFGGIPEHTASLLVFFSRLWAMCGFPAIRPSHRLAASFMSTVVPPGLIPEIHLPWPATVIDVPDGILDCEGTAVRLLCLLHGEAEGLGMASSALDGFNYALFLLGPKSELVGSFGLQDLLEMASPAKYEDETLALFRRREMACRLVLSALIELDSPVLTASRALGPPARSARRADKVPTAWVFELKRDITVDCRSAVGDYLRGAGRSPSVQVLVRGHQKRQACGAGRSERRWIHIEPYWRGPEDAPIAVRRHVLEVAS